MIPKPDHCRGCRWYGDGQGFVPDEIDEDAQVVFVYQNPGQTEEIQGRPMIGKTGQMFRARFVKKHLPSVKIAHANVLKCRFTEPDGKKSNKMPKKDSKDWWEIVAHCAPYLAETLKKCGRAIVVPMGEHAALALTRRRAKSMLHLRGTVVEE